MGCGGSSLMPPKNGMVHLNLIFGAVMIQTAPASFNWSLTWETPNIGTVIKIEVRLMTSVVMLISWGTNGLNVIMKRSYIDGPSLYFIILQALLHTFNQWPMFYEEAWVGEQTPYYRMCWMVWMCWGYSCLHFWHTWPCASDRPSFS